MNVNGSKKKLAHLRLRNIMRKIDLTAFELKAKTILKPDVKHQAKRKRKGKNIEFFFEQKKRRRIKGNRTNKKDCIKRNWG